MPAPKGHPAYNKNAEGGHPLLYDDEFLEKEAKAFQDWMKLPGSLYFKRFAIDRGYHPNRLAEFAEKNERFMGVYLQAKAWQEVRLAEGGMTNELNATFTKFVMGNVCGWADRTETKISGDGANPLSFIVQQTDGSSKDLVNGKNIEE